MDKIFKEEFIFLNEEINSKKEAFEFIAQKAFEFKISTSVEALINGLNKREEEGSTGFEDGFAIPHARIKEIVEPAVFVVKFKNGIDWQSMDGKKTKVAIALLVPKGKNGDQHLEILSDIATKLTNEKFKKGLIAAKTKDAVLKLLMSENNKKDQNITTKNSKTKGNIVGITACIVGIAHTYMAEEKLLETGKKLGYNIRIETQGSRGVGGKLTEQEIENADIVILATDTSIDKSRFIGKKVYSLKVSDAIKNPEKTINEAFEKGATFSPLRNDSFSNKNGKKEADRSQGPLQHILAGISYMIPIIILGGICLAFSIGIAKAAWGPTAGTNGKNGDSTWNVLNTLNIIGGAAFTLMIPILGAFIANSISGRSAIAPALVSSYIGNSAGTINPDNTTTPGDLMPWISGMKVVQTPLGFIGAIIAGLSVGYFVKWVNTWRVPKSLAPAMPIFFVPIVAGVGMSFIFIYVIGAPVGWVMQNVQDGIKDVYNSGTISIGVGLGFGIILGAMAGFDMGGPINKIAFVTCSMLVTSKIYYPMGAMAAGIPVAPLGMGLSTIIFRRFFNNNEKGLGVSAMIMGSIGISEGAIPFAIRDPKRAIVCNVIGSGVAGGIAGAFKIEDSAAHGGPIVAILGAVPYGVQTLYFFIAIICGVIVTTFTYGFWLIKDAGAYGSVKEAHVRLIADSRADKADKIEALRNEKREAKREGKNDLVLSILSEIAKIKADTKAKIAISKQAYLANKADEADFIKTQKQSIKVAISDINKDFATKKASLKSEIKECKASKQREKLDILELKMSELIDEKEEKIIKYHTNLREEYLKKYLLAIG
ncbi:fructose-specific PTS transporter subunit EIIC [Spiroplasma endosymbiont of Aspidapion aeneum]|uniref:PTS fructose transporter subunit IIABC n=1 Tax=Spiroplasma endosymbiont of Aspidapion aeneum TaxID=3066276 RepID=UPI00313B8299